MSCRTSPIARTATANICSRATRPRPSRSRAARATPINYAADQGARQLQISTTQRIADSHNGFEVFVDIPEGNGTFSTASTWPIPARARSAWVRSWIAPSWVPDDYTITFTSPTTYEVTDGATPANVGADRRLYLWQRDQIQWRERGRHWRAGDRRHVLSERSRSKDIFATIGERGLT